MVSQTAYGAVYLGPNADSSGNVSTINFPISDNRAASVTLGLGGGGVLYADYNAPTGNTTHLLFEPPWV